MTLFLKNFLFTVFVPGTVGVLVPLLLARGRQPVAGPTLVAALACLALGAAAYGWSLWNFATRGRGTPLPVDAPRKLVAGGPYRYSRNPMYLGVLAAILGWLLAFQTAALLIYGLAVAAAFNLFVIGYEEPHLRRLFGAEYDAYRRRVPRWLPRLRPAAMTDDSGAA